MKKHKKSLALLSLMTVATLILLGSIYWIRPEGSPLFEGVRQRKAGTDLTKHSRILGHEVILERDSSLILNKTRLIYRGIRDGMVCIDLFLLELDPQTPYHHFVPTSQAGKVFCLGSARYRLVSAGRSQVRLVQDGW